MKAWDDFLQRLEKKLGKYTVKKWLMPIKVLKFDAANLFLEATDSFQILWFQEHITEDLKDANDRKIKIHFYLNGKPYFIRPKKTRVDTSPAKQYFSPDHLDVHKDLKAYEDAKNSIWKNLSSDDIAVAGIDDEVVSRNIPSAGSTITFGLHIGDSRTEGHTLVVKDFPLMEVKELARSAPHDILNALAAATIASEGGASNEAIIEVLTTFTGLPHRITYLGTSQGVEWFNDSKSTTPHSVAAAVQGYDNVVLIVGGRNKGIDLTSLVSLEKHLKAVIAIGEAAEDISQIFKQKTPLTTAETMEEAVSSAHAQSESGDKVILSPGCASFDWYENYEERGDHFSNLVNEMILGKV